MCGSRGSRKLTDKKIQDNIRAACLQWMLDTLVYDKTIRDEKQRQIDLLIARSPKPHEKKKEGKPYKDRLQKRPPRKQRSHIVRSCLKENFIPVVVQPVVVEAPKVKSIPLQIPLLNARQRGQVRYILPK